MEFLSLNYDTIRDSYPKALKKVVDWYRNNPTFKEALKEIGGDIEAEELLERTVEMIVQFDPRKLYDVFDSFGVFISISGENNILTYRNNKEMYSHTADSRIAAEKAAFIDAFQELENQL